MYEIVRSEPLEQYKTPMEIDVGLMINKAAGAAVYQPDLRDIIVINYDGQQKGIFQRIKGIYRSSRIYRGSYNIGGIK